MDKESYLAFVKPFITINLDFSEQKDLALLTFQSQIVYAKQLNDLIAEFFVNIDLSRNLEIASTNGISNEDYYTCINALKQTLESYEIITPENTNEIVNKVKEISGLKGKPLFMPLRLIAIGKEHGPEMNKILPIIGKQKILSNIQ
jgi:nondiscriminating glutamyl-tRNA synthetase